VGSVYWVENIHLHAASSSKKALQQNHSKVNKLRYI